MITVNAIGDACPVPVVKTRKAMETITGTWNAEHAAGELLRFSKELLTGEPKGADDGPLSPAPVISERRMYSWMCQ